MKKRIISLAFLMPLVAVALFLASCNDKKNPPDTGTDTTAQKEDTVLLEYNLLSDLVLKALLNGHATTSLRANVKAARKAGDPKKENSLDEAEAVYETMRSETNTLTASTGKVIGTCCCPCDDPMQMNNCPCPTYYLIKFIEKADGDTSSIRLDSIQYESEAAGGDLEGFRVFTLPDNTTVSDGKHTLTIEGSFVKGGPPTTYQIDIIIDSGKAYFIRKD